MMDINQILDYASEHKASDVHITPDRKVAIRIHGKIQYLGEPASADFVSNVSLQVLKGKHQAHLDEYRDVDFMYATPQKNRFRGNAFYTREGLSMAFRAIAYEIPDFKDLGLPSFVLDHVVKLKTGLVLVVGPTGHGKSTTLASLIKERSQRKDEHFILMEDPVEFIIPSTEKSIIHQRSVGEDVVSFSRGLKSALREDPDVMMVGEMRDLETVSSALTAAETGHVVFSTLHTNDAPETINRIIDAFPTEQQMQVKVQLAQTLAMVISQRLIQSTDGGRVMAYEIMTTNYAVKNHIRQGSMHQIYNAMQTDDTGHMVLFDQSLAQLVIQGKVTRDEAENNAHSVEQLEYILDLHDRDNEE